MPEKSNHSLDFILKDLKTNLKRIYISLTNNCNLNCRHCAPESGPLIDNSLDKQSIIKLIQQFRNLKGEVISFSGGEPFTSKDLFELISISVECGLKVTIETNGTLINSKTALELSKFKENLAIGLSLDGFSSSSHDWFRRKKGAFELMKNTIDLLDNSSVYYMVSTVMHSRNKDEIGEMIDFFVFNKNTRFRLVPFISRQGRASKVSANSIFIPNKEIVDFLQNEYLPIYKKAAESGLRDLMIIDAPKAVLPAEIEIFTTCPYGFGILGINPEGKPGICHRTSAGSKLAVNEVSINDQLNLHDLWYDNKLFDELRDISENNLCGICANCIFNSDCRGYCRNSAYEFYGDIYAPYPICQELYEEDLFPLNSMININKSSNYNKHQIN